MKIAEIVNKNDQELQSLITSTQADLAKAVIDSRTKENRDVKQFARLKKTIAQALTIAREREIAKEEQN